MQDKQLQFGGLVVNAVEPEVVNVTWKDVEKFVVWLTLVVRGKGINPSGVYAPPRGGLLLAVMLSHSLDVPFLTEPVKDCLVVDDIVDTGRALCQYKGQDVYTASMFYNKSLSCFEPDFWKWLKTDTWIKFPWEFRLPEDGMSDKEIAETTKHNETYRGK